MYLKKVRKKMFGVLITGILAAIMSIFYTSANTVVTAETKMKETSKEKAWLFAVPEGGWSSIRVNVSYWEYYVLNTERIYYTGRVMSEVHKAAGATEIPTVNLNYVKHSLGANFTSWKNESMWIDGSKWDYGKLLRNENTQSYLRGKKVTGSLYYGVSCRNAVVPMYGDSLEMDLTYYKYK